jgi:hypothetical protein
MLIKRGLKRGSSALAQAWSSGRDDKKGSHVGVIASFAVFVMFLIGLYMVTQPALKTQKDKELFMEYLEINLKNQFSNNLTTAIVDIIPSPLGGCGNIGNPCVTADWTDVGWHFAGDLIVKDENGIILDPSGLVTPCCVGAQCADKENLWFYLSKEFGESPEDITSMCPPGLPLVGTLDSVRVEKRLFESRILNGIVNYSTTLRGNLTIPPDSDFSVGFQYNNGTIISAGEKNVTTNILAKEIPIQYVDRNATLLSGKLIVKVW